MQTHRLRSPSGNGSLLADPPIDQAPRLLEANAERLDGWDYDFQGRSADRLRSMARAQVIAAAGAFHDRYGLLRPDGPAQPDRLVVTGHQPELFHPGVWVKNFAAAGIARAAGASALNLIVDNDIPKGPAVRVPFLDDGRLLATTVPFDARASVSPYEDHPVRDEATFASFADRAMNSLGDLVPRPLVASFWPKVLARAADTNLSGLRFALARHEQEAEWGVNNWEVPIGRACETEAFAWFASHLLAQLPRFRDVHNAALGRYRKAYGLRGKNHPVPELAREGDWIEAPFWAWRKESPRRRPLMARQLSRTIELRIDGEDAPFSTLPLSPDRDACCAVEKLLELPGLDVRLRTRALTTTMFARYLIGDLFLHGIGGAKYDELGDEVARDFFGIDPPGFVTLSLTRWLDLPDDPSTVARKREVDARLRDLSYNPDRHIPRPIPAEACEAVEAKWVAIEAEVDTRARRRERGRQIQAANRGLLPFVEDQRRTLVAERDRVASGLEWNAVAHSREYAFPLHDEAGLKDALTRLSARQDQPA